VFATRTPHRPCPIGLTVAKVEGIKGATLLLSGADLVDGTPVLDIKPYLPYCDSVPESSAPSWVQVGFLPCLKHELLS
jgi:tRNA (Thr-GGU) A37 N-methylase